MKYLCLNFGSYMNKSCSLKQIWTRFVTWHTRVQERQREGHKLSNTDPFECEERECLNCGYRFRGHNCPNCGQDADTKRFTMKSATNDLFITLIGGDSVFLKTCGNLLYRPGYMIHDFLCGKRTRYFHPVEMLLCLVTIYALVTFCVDDETFNFFSDVANRTATDDSPFAQAAMTLQNFLSNTVAFSLLFAFINVLPYKLLFKRRTITCPDGESRRLNTAEHFVTLIYLSCMNIIVSLFLLVIQMIPNTESFMTKLEFFLPIIFFYMGIPTTI